jgi:hypothetical protein
MSSHNERRLIRQFQRAQRTTLIHERAQASADPCHDCLVRDPEALFADPDLARKLEACTIDPAHHILYCHQGMAVEVREDGTHGAYRPPMTPEGTPDTTRMTPCGGAARWMAPYATASKARVRQAIQALLVTMARRFLAQPAQDDLQEACAGDVARFVACFTQPALRAQWDSTFRAREGR